MISLKKSELVNPLYIFNSYTLYISINILYIITNLIGLRTKFEYRHVFNIIVHKNKNGPNFFFFIN